MVELIAPYGGVLKQSICSDFEHLTFDQEDGEKVVVSADDGSLLEFEQLCYGHYSPLDSFPCLSERKQIYTEGQLSNGLTFPIPPLFACTTFSYQDSLFLQGKRVFVARDTEIIGYLDVEEVSLFDDSSKREYCEAIFGTCDATHPGVAYIFSLSEVLLSGKATLFSGKGLFASQEFMTAAQMRDLFCLKGYTDVCAFSTTNAPHRAHEHLIRTALETQDAVLIHALHIVGTSKSAKYPLNVVKSAYDALCTHYFAQDSLIFAIFPSLVRSAGPRSSLLQAIIRQNFGCQKQIYGRDHEGFASFYGMYDSQRAVRLAKDISLRPLCLSGPYFCQKCDQVVSERSCGHKHSDFEIPLSGTKVRELLASGILVPSYLLRSEVYDVLCSYYEKDIRGEQSRGT